MNNVTNPQRRPLLMIVLGLCVLSLAVSGCEPLRKKFTRKKKEEAREIEPILTPIEYEAPQTSAQERYAYHYSLWKVWQEEMINAINEEESDKKQKYLFSQILLQLGEMKKWIVEEKKRELDTQIEKMSSLQPELERSAALRNDFSFRKRIELIGKDIRNTLSAKIVYPPNKTP